MAKVEDEDVAEHVQPAHDAHGGCAAGGVRVCVGSCCVVVWKLYQRALMWLLVWFDGGEDGVVGGGLYILESMAAR